MREPDFIFRKYKGHYSIKIFFPDLTCFHGEGETITKAMDSILEQNGIDLPEVRSFITFLDERDLKQHLNQASKKKKDFTEINIDNLPYYEAFTKDIIKETGEIPGLLLFSRERIYIRKRAILFEAMNLCGINDVKIAHLTRRTREVVVFIRKGISSQDKEKAKELSLKIKPIIERMKKEWLL